MTAIHQLESTLAERYLALAIEHSRKGRWEQAEVELARVRSLLPEDPVVPMTLARIRYHQGRRQEALHEIVGAERLGGPMSEIEVMRSEILESDQRKFQRVEEQVANRRMRREHYSSLVDRLEEAIFSLSSRELVYLMLGTAFLLTVIWWDLRGIGGVG